MAKINLLPWREELRKQKQQNFIIATVCSAFLGLIIIVIVHMYIDGINAYQGQRNLMLQNEIAVLDKKIIDIKGIEEKKKKLLSKIDLIQQLQESRPKIVHLFDEIPKATPDGVFLTKFVQKGDELIFEGKSQSNARVSAFMRAIDASPWLQRPTLKVIQIPQNNTQGKEDAEKLSEFTLNARQGEKNNPTETWAAQ